MNRSLLVTAAGAALLLAASPGVSGGEIVAYVSSLTEDSIVRLRDTNGDGDLNDAGESAVFFGPGNADGWLGVGSAQAILVLGPDHVLAADGEESGGYVTRVYRLRDRNGDGDAMDAGEATEFWDSILPLGVNYDRPKAMTVGPDGAIYLADNNTINFDYDTPEAVWRLEDLNADGDVNDPGEVTLYLQLSPADSHFGFICEDFKWDAAGRLWFSNQDSSSNTGTVWIVEPDLTLRQFVSDSDDLLGIGLNKTGMTLHPETGNPVLGGYDVFENRRILELVDLNGNGVIDDVDETLSRYRSDVAAEPLLWDLNNVMDVDYAPDGALWLLDNAHKTVLRFEDLGGDGDYLDPGEAAEIYDAATAGNNGGFAMDFPRTIGFALFDGSGDCDGDGDVDLADFAYWSECATGPLEPPVYYGWTCAALDTDHDGNIDLADFAALQPLFVP